jgi:hypothetical protein
VLRTAPESEVRSAAPGGSGGRLRRPGGAAGRGSESGGRGLLELYLGNIAP